MESKSKSKISRTFKRVILSKKSAKNHSYPAGFCLPIVADGRKARCIFESHKQQLERESAEAAAMEECRSRAFVARLFAAVSSIKAAYAELQTAQMPYDDAAVQSADQAVVDELKSLSELKRRFLKDQIGSSPPHVTMMLAEIREQQSQMRIYEITMKKMQDEIERKGKRIASLGEELREIVRDNRVSEKKIGASGSFSVLDSVGFSDFSAANFVLVLRYALRSVRNFVRLLIREMESANWDVEAAAKAAQPCVAFGKKDHMVYAFESFVCREIFSGFDIPNFSIERDDLFSPGEINRRRAFFFEQFRNLRSVGAVQFLEANPNSRFGNYLRSKYLKSIHPKMEFSFWGNLNQRKAVSSGRFPGNDFFKAFAEVCRRAWLVHCLMFSFEEKVEVFQVGRNSRFSDLYMSSVADDVLAAAGGRYWVAFTVVPGFKFRRTVVQSQVYLSPR